MGERYLGAQLESFLRQSRLPDELVVRDDGSTDRTLEILDAFATAAPFAVRILPAGERLGYARNFEAVLAAAQGDLVFLSDQDDVWDISKLERVERCALENPEVALFINDIENVDDQLGATGVTTLGNLRGVGLSDEAFVTGCATAVRRSFLNFALPLPEGEVAHDVWLHACAQALRRRLVIADVLQRYRRHGQTTSDWAGGRPARLSRLGLYGASLRNDRLASHRQQWCRVRALLQRFEQVGSGLIRPQDDAAAIMRELTLREAALAARVAVLETPWPRRLPAALKLWWRNGYHAFLGWRSMISDLMNRPLI